MGQCLWQYGPATITQVISRVHPVHLMNVEHRQAAADPQTKPTNLGCESTCRLLLSTSAILLLLSSNADTHFTVHGG